MAFDWLALLLSGLGKAADHNEKTVAKRQEAFRLIAEANGEIQRSLDLINFSEQRLLGRIQQIDDVGDTARKAISDTLGSVRLECEAAGEMLTKIRDGARDAGGRQLDQALVGLVEVNATSKRFLPWVEAVVARFDAVLADPS